MVKWAELSHITNSFCDLDSVIGLFRSESKVVSLEQGVQAAEVALTSPVNAGFSNTDCTNTEACKPLKNNQNTAQLTEPSTAQSNSSLEPWLDAEQIVK